MRNKPFTSEQMKVDVRVLHALQPQEVLVVLGLESLPFKNVRDGKEMSS